MTDFKLALAQFSAHQAEREAWAKVELQRLKQAVVPALALAGIAKVAILFDGYGDSGAVEEIVCLDAAGGTLVCPDTEVASSPTEGQDGANCADPIQLSAALKSLAYLALERHHPGWEKNDGAGGKLEIGVGAGTFVLECNLRFTDYTQHSTEV